VVGRAGTGVDNVDVPAATERGIIVVNAAGSNAVSAAEHAIALMLAQARNIPQAHSALVDGRWERSKFGGIEVTGKTLGVIGFGNIGQLVAERALGLGMRVVAYDPFVADARYREMGVEKAESLDEIYPECDFITLHVASTPETRGFINADAIGKMRDGVRIINDARGDLIVEADLVAAIEGGKVAGAAIDVFPAEPATDSPYFGVAAIIVTPHLGASTGEAQERAGVACAEQVAAALTGGVVTSAVNIPVVSAETMATVGPFLPLAGHLGRLAAGIAGGITGVTIVLILTLYFMASLRSMKRVAARFVPAYQRDTFSELLEDVSSAVGRYVIGQASLALTNGILSLIFLSIIGAPVPALLALIAFIGSMIPLVGTLSASIIISLICLFESPTTALIAVVYYLVYMQIEAYVLSPRIMSRAVAVPGALVVIAAVAGGALGGILGALVAVPIAASIIIIVQKVVFPTQDRKRTPPAVTVA